MPRQITPVEDWELGTFLNFQPARAQEDGVVWVNESGPDVNLDVSYLDGNGIHNADMYLTPDDAERIGVMLQYAAKLAREKAERRAQRKS